MLNKSNADERYVVNIKISMKLQTALETQAKPVLGRCETLQILVKIHFKCVPSKMLEINLHELCKKRKKNVTHATKVNIISIRSFRKKMQKIQNGKYKTDAFANEINVQEQMYLVIYRADAFQHWNHLQVQEMTYFTTCKGSYHH